MASLAVVIGLAPLGVGAQTFGPLLGSEIPFDVDRGNNVSVADRPRPELSPIGVREGAFLIFPALTVGAGYTTNVYGATDNGVGDAYANILPEVSAVSQWSRNLLEFHATGGFKAFASQSVKSENAYSVSTNGRLDVVGDSNIVGVLRYERFYEAQYSGAFPTNAAGSVGVNRAEAILRGTAEFSRVRGILSFDVNNLKYSDTRSITGEELDQGYRDRSVYRVSGRAEYAFNPEVAAFVQATYLRSAYNATDQQQLDRSNQEVRLLTGFTFDLSKLIRAAIGVGYVHRSYNQAFYPSVGGVAADVRLDYFPDELTTISFGLDRRIEDAITANSPGYLATQVQVHVDHELLRELILFAEATYEDDVFKAVTRQDDQYQLRGGGVYSVGRHYRVTPSLWWIKRTTSGEPLGQAFSELRGMVAFTAQY